MIAVQAVLMHCCIPLLIFSISLTSAVYGANNTNIAGGTGGKPFADRAPAQDVRIAAVMVGSGSWIDSVQVLYQSRDGSRFSSEKHGGAGGGPGVFALEPEEYIVAISGHYAQYVHSLRIHTNKRESRVYGSPSGTPFRIDVPRGHSVVGFVGRSGAYLDAVGLALTTRSPRSDVALNQSPPTQSGSNNAPPTPQAAVPALARKPSYSTKVQPNGNYVDATFRIDLTSPAPIQLVIGDHDPGVRSCFRPSYRPITSSPQRPPSIQHSVTVRNLQLATRYYYVIRIGGNKCESGDFITATIIDRP